MPQSSQQPRLLITHRDGSQVHGKCSLCEHRLHAFIRNTEQEARLLLNRGFKHHCRGKHEMVVPVPTKISTPRRSTRVAADVLIEVQGEKFAYAGETITVNLHGALVRVAARLKVGDRIMLYVHSTRKSAPASVVFVDEQASQFGLELDIPENIWGMPDPPADWVTSAS
jgi:PilZ domain-containing protein